MRTATLLIMLAACSPRYEEGYEAGCALVEQAASDLARGDAEACRGGDPGHLCYQEDPDSEYGMGWLDGCYDCFDDIYYETRRDLWDAEACGPL